MQILIPDICVPNTYIHDLASALEALGHQVIWGSDTFFYSQWQPEAILSQWPEGYFRALRNIKNLQPEHLDALQCRLEELRSKTLIIAFVHNIKARPTGDRHLDSRLEKLYQISYGAAHGLIHLGKASQRELATYYPPQIYLNKPSLVISQGLHEQLRQAYPASKVSTKITSEFRIFVPGAIRTWTEVSFVLQAFSKARISNKKLAIAGSGRVLSGKRPLNLLRRTSINRLPNVFVYGHRLDDRQLCQEIVSAEIIVSPRLWATNSAIPYLAATYGKRCIGPNISNLTEVLKELNGIVFEPDDPFSLTKAMETAYAERELVSLPDPPCPSWQEIAKRIENFITPLSKSTTK